LVALDLRIFLGFSGRHATLVAPGDIDEYAMYAELGGTATQLDGEPGWRFGPAGRVSSG